MPPPLPDRYALEVRLGRDGDVEEWLATDTSLDRPVLIRLLGPDAAPGRRTEFLEAVRAVAGVNHPHLASVFTAGETPDGVYAVSEWTGAVSLADRLASGQPIEAGEFLSNAAGLASALAAVHAAGEVHGTIDAGALFYAVAHPARLGGIGRARRHHTAIADVQALATVLELGLTGSTPGGAPPSEMVDGLDRRVDQALRAGQDGRLTAQQLAEALTAAPTPIEPVAESPVASRRLLLTAAGLVAAAAALVLAGWLLLAGAGSPIRIPIAARPPSTLPLPTPTTVPPPATTVPATGPVTVIALASFDPSGDSEENDGRLPNLTDKDPDTVWRTEQYRDPLPLLKPGVGVTFEIEGIPGRVELVGITSGAEYQLGWAAQTVDQLDGWESVVRGRTLGGDLILQLPIRSGGTWLLWFTDLPVSGEGHSAEVGEVLFHP